MPFKDRSQASANAPTAGEGTQMNPGRRSPALVDPRRSPLRRAADQVRRLPDPKAILEPDRDPSIDVEIYREVWKTDLGVQIDYQPGALSRAV
jgi:hypothetical protein